MQEKLEVAMESLETLTEEELKPENAWDKEYLKGEKEPRLRYLVSLLFQLSGSKHFLGDKEKEILRENREWLQERKVALEKEAAKAGHVLEFYMLFRDAKTLNCVRDCRDVDLSNPFCFSVVMPFWMRSFFAIQEGPSKPSEWELELAQRKREIICLTYISKDHNLDKIGDKMSMDTKQVIALIERMQREDKMDIKGFSLAKLKKRTRAERKKNLAQQLVFRGHIKRTSDFTESNYKEWYGDELD
ncbi:hypothetical protein ES702_03940 [subsurface metagenome]